MTSELDVPDSNVADLSGYSCPMVVRLAEKFVGSLPTGSIVLVISTDPQSQIDIPAWIWDSGNRLVKETREGASWRFLIEKTGGSAKADRVAASKT